MVKYGGWFSIACFLALLFCSTTVQAQVMPDSEGATLKSSGAEANPSGGEFLDFRRSTAGIFFGYDFEVEDPFLGGEGRFSFDLAPNFAASLNPALSYYFISEQEFFGVTSQVRLLQFDLNALAHLIIDGPIEPYVGLGLAVQNSRVRVTAGSSESSDSETGLGLNIVAGTEVNIDGPLVPFAQLRVTVGEAEQIDRANFLALMGGLAYEF